MATEMQLRGVTRPEPINQTRDLIVDWDRATRHVKSLREQLEKAEKDLIETEQRLGRHLSPEDRKHDEAFQIWFGSGLLKVLYGDRFYVSWRKYPTKGIY